MSFSFDDHLLKTNGGVFSAIPLDSDTGSSGSLLSNPSSHVTHKYHHANSNSLQDAHNVSGFIFGLRSGFASHLLLGLLCVFAFNDQIGALASDECPSGVIFLTFAWIIATATTAVLSSKTFVWMNQTPQQTCSEEQQFHLYHGCLIGMFFSWVLFDLLLETELVVVAIHFGVAVAGHCYIKSTRKLFLQKRRSNRVIIIDDDLLKSLDLA